jgi:hypothetical protein
MVTYFIGGAIGSALGAFGWAHWGWNGVCLAGTLQLLIALAVRSWMHFTRGGVMIQTTQETANA